MVEEKPTTEKIEIKTSKWRFSILILTWAYKFITSFQYVECLFIPNVVSKYFQIQVHLVSQTAVIMSVIFLVLNFPMVIFIENYGLKNSSLLAATCLSIGSIIKCFIAPRSFALFLTGQGFIGVSNLVATLVPTLVAAEWFPDGEISTVTGFLISAQFLGNSLGMVIPPIILTEKPYKEGSETMAETVSNVHSQFQGILIPQAILSVLIFALISTLHPKEPVNPPSASALFKKNFEESRSQKSDIFRSFKDLVNNRNFLFLGLSYGLSVGATMTFVTMMNPMIKTIASFPQNTTSDPDFSEDTMNYTDKLISQLSFVQTLSGFFGTILCGKLLDYLPFFKSSNLLCIITTTTFCSSIFMMKFLPLWGIFIIFGSFGLFANSIYPISFQLGAEITFPAPEGTMAGFLAITSHLFCFLLTYSLITIQRYINCEKSCFLTLGLIIGSYVLSLIFLFFVREDRKRENSKSRHNSTCTQVSEF